VVFTSIGPGWFNTLIAQNTAMSNGLGFLVLAGDKTTAYEGPNMQQLMRDGQFGFVAAAGIVSKKAYAVIDPRNVYSVMREALAKTRGRIRLSSSARRKRLAGTARSFCARAAARLARAPRSRPWPLTSAPPWS